MSRQRTYHRRACFVRIEPLSFGKWRWSVHHDNPIRRPDGQLIRSIGPLYRTGVTITAWQARLGAHQAIERLPRRYQR